MAIKKHSCVCFDIELIKQDYYRFTLQKNFICYCYEMLCFYLKQVINTIYS